MLKSKRAGLLLATLLLTSLVLGACGDSPTNTVVATQAATTAATSATTAASSATTAAASATTAAGAAPATTAAAGAKRDAAFYGLKPNKPYNGTKLNYLICCPTATQFASLTKRTAAEFKELTGIEVKWDDGPYNAFQQRLLTEAVSGSGNYDVVAWVDSWGAGIKPYLQPLNDKIAEAKLDLNDYSPAYIKAASSDDGKTVYGIPLRGHAQVLFYRKDVFEQLGLKPPTTWQEVAETGKVIREKTKLDPISVYYGVNAGQNLFLWLSHLWGNGSDIFDAKYKPTFNNAQGVEATNAYIGLVRTTKLTGQGSLAFGEQDASLEMVQGRAAMFAGWSWIYDRFQDPKLVAPEVKDKVGFVPAPGWAGKAPSTYAQIWPTGILKSSKNQDAAWEFIKWLTHPQTEKDVATDKSNPATNNIVAVRLSSLKDPAVNATTGGLQNVMANVLTTARTQPLLPEWPEIERILEVAVNEMAGGKDVKATLDKAAKDVEQIMQRGGYYK
jgi:multiple sugar transport system substrate-binding protein